MSRRLLIAVAVLVGVLLLPVSVSAHELIKDQSGGLGTLFYISPDDDPVAGRRATLFFEFPNTTIAPESSRPKLTITDDHGEVADAPVTTSGSGLSADYVFPRQGVYKIALAITVDDAAHLFSRSVQVSRGAAGSAAGSSAPTWAVAGMAITLAAAALTAGIVLKRRKIISEYSRMVQ